jgi:hypothetical protein
MNSMWLLTEKLQADPAGLWILITLQVAGNQLPVELLLLSFMLCDGFKISA